MHPQLQIMLQQAIQAFQGGNFDGADSILKRVLQVDSKNLPALHVLGLIKASQANYKEAADYLARAARIHPNDASIQYNLAKALTDSGNDKEALNHHKKAVSLDPNNPEAWLSYGKTASNLGRHQDALAWYSKALSLKPDYAEGWLNKGATLKELKSYEEAIAFADQALAINPHLAEAWSNKGGALKELKRYDEAIAHYDKALSLKPDYTEAWSNKGNVLHELKRYDEAIAHYDKALSLKPDYTEAWSNKGNVLHELKRYDEAIAHYDKALSLKPDYTEAWSNKGNVLHELKRYDEAIAHYDKALSLKPDYTEGWSNKGVTLHELKRYDEAIAHYDKALSLKPDYTEAWSNKGNVLHELKRYDEAIAHYDKALSLKPDYTEAWSNKGGALKELKRYDEAIAHYDKALSLKPDYTEAWSNKGNVLHELKRYDEAIAHYDKALSLKPDYAEGWLNKGATLKELKSYDEAIAHYDKALSLKPDYAEGWFNKGIVLNAIARPVEARNCFEKAIEQSPDFYRARWGKLFTTIPAITIGNENIQELREQFSFELEKISEWFLSKNLGQAYEVIGDIQPFYLAYQELNNKKLLHEYGQLCNRLMQDWQKLHNLQYDLKIEDKRIKLGVVGEQIRYHSVWNAITKGLVSNLDASKFEVHIFHLGSDVDEETCAARLKAASFNNNYSSLLDWAKAITEKKIDVLLYPEIGMDALTTQLACLRLAPIQLVSWGHPETTGLPTIDYYLSAELFENESSQDAYTETLVKLPNLGCYYSRLPIVIAKFDFEAFGIDPNEPILICPGTPYKYAPQNDWILADIARRLGKGKLIFFDYQTNFTQILKLRLKKVFNEANLALSDYVVFIPWQKPGEFYGLMKCADVYLDTIGFSGFNSAMQAVDCALPIVAKECNFMRGNFASGILKKMAIPELIAKTDNAYVELAVRLVQDSLYRNQIENRIIQTRDTLYDDIESIRAFENFLLKKVEHSSRI
jgi:protein O-GlcNAc transferase